MTTSQKYIILAFIAFFIAGIVFSESIRADEHSAIIQEFMNDAHVENQARYQRYQQSYQSDMDLNRQLFNARFNAWAAQQNSKTLQFGGGLPPQITIRTAE